MYVKCFVFTTQILTKLANSQTPSQLQNLGVFLNREVPAVTVILTTTIAHNDSCTAKAIRSTSAVFAELPATMFA